MNLYALRKAETETRLDEIDPEWRTRFLGDWQRAEEFYCTRRAGRVIHSSPYEPPTIVDDREDDIDFDDGLTDEDFRDER